MGERSMTPEERSAFAFGVERSREKPAKQMPEAILTDEESAEKKARNRQMFDQVIAKRNADFARLEEVRGGINKIPGGENTGEALVKSMESRIHELPGLPSEPTAIVERPKPPKESWLGKLFGKK